MSTIDTDAALPTRYEDAMTELKTIVTAIESAKVDLDDLSAYVERAAKLIELCQKRLGDTKMQVNKVLARLD